CARRSSPSRWCCSRARSQRPDRALALAAEVTDRPRERGDEGSQVRRREGRGVVLPHVDRQLRQLVEGDLAVTVAVRHVVGGGLLVETKGGGDRRVRRSLEAIVEEVIAVGRELGGVGAPVRDHDAERIFAFFLVVAVLVRGGRGEAPVKGL